MNAIELQALQEVNNLLDTVLDGKVENLPQAKEAKRLIFDLIEFRDFSCNEVWKFAQD